MQIIKKVCKYKMSEAQMDTISLEIIHTKQNGRDCGNIRIPDNLLTTLTSTKNK